MAKADVIADVSVLSNFAADTVSAGNFYDEVVTELGRAPWLTNFTLLPVIVQGQLSFDLPATAVSLRGVVYDNRWLHESRLREVEPLMATWRRGQRGTYGPLTYVLEESSHLTFDVYPSPGIPGATIPSPIPYDSTFPLGNIFVIFTEYRSTLPKWLEEAVTFGVLAREYDRSSDHLDPDAAALAKQISDFLLAMVS